ncbi:hypothetical protein VB773_06415 [Haloarculaceae archaeon H-GB2-1]|nr:hypothetical protein [Haloarculaceae archaeon H-GB2-1]
MKISLRPIMGETEMAVSWLAERNILPHKSWNGRYTLKETDGSSRLGPAAKLLIVDNLGISSDEDLDEMRNMVRNHPRWD